MFTIHKDAEGENVEIVYQTETEVFLRQELRDTTCWWFYWSFHADNLPKEKVAFNFCNREVVGPFGPAVSLDGENWEWLGAKSSPDRKTFTYSNTAGHKRVYFALSHCYRSINLKRFIDKHKKNPLFNASVLTVSEKGADIPIFTIGKQGAERHIFLTARHHACEATGSYVLEGFIEQLFSAGNGILKNHKIHVVPFIDYDGVIAGDQGKRRAPHDHNRDYEGDSIYASVRAVKALADNYGGKIAAAFDFHSPWLWGGDNDTAHILRAENRPDGALRFFEIMRARYGAAGESGQIPFDGRNDVGTGEKRNSSELNLSMFIGYMNYKKVPLALLTETPYFGTPDTFTVTPENMRGLGRRYALALEDYFKHG